MRVPKIDLRDYFKHVRVINLDGNSSRWMDFEMRADDSGIEGYLRFSGVHGDTCPAPAWWRAGNNAWGCMMSHLRAAQDALMATVSGHLLMFEDDVVFCEDFAARLPSVMSDIGDDWDMLYLGGQHLFEFGLPYRIEGESEILHGRNINRTHAFAVHNRFLVKYAQHIIHAPDYMEGDRKWHIDHQLGYLHQNQGYKILAAHPWLCGQAAGESLISGNKNPEMWWHTGDDKIASCRDFDS